MNRNTRRIHENKRRVIFSLLLLLISFLAVLLFFILKPSDNKASNQFREDSSAVGYQSKLKKPQDFTKEQIALPGFSKIYVKEGEEKTNYALSNPSFNEVYFKYKVIFKNTNETLLETEAIAPGKAIIGFPLPKDLQEGEYPVIIKISTYDQETKTRLNGGESTVPLIVKKEE
ncbi:hypothetical protein [Lactococcus garvieae]|uniref:Uncharacterized protein n=1 Tax=Lactococcus garvieae TaxID=1363 RepID=A0A1I4J575_9LACT|nr:hypothetical protein [Lactococcus garvieae]SFL61291.1 hypothetical protein SAMN05216438_1303 [Lactococcus garvieae]